jgi:hypothetical protein
LAPNSVSGGESQFLKQTPCFNFICFNTFQLHLFQHVSTGQLHQCQTLKLMPQEPEGRHQAYCGTGQIQAVPGIKMDHPGIPKGEEHFFAGLSDESI